MWDVGGLTPKVTLASTAPLPQDSPVLVFVLLGFVPLPLLLALVLALFLTAVELRQMRANYLWWIWWLLLVFMTHFVGYLILRVYAFTARRRAQPQS